MDELLRPGRGKARKTHLGVDWGAIGHATGTGVLKMARLLMIMPLTCVNESGRRESNPHDQLGRLRPAAL
jgi:hypothetical protein